MKTTEEREIDIVDIQAMLVAGIQHLGLELTEQCILLIIRYLKLLLRWNARINLVGSKELPELIHQHILDSLAVVRYVPVNAYRVVDVGSGAGLPGVLIAIARPEVNVVALEPNHKKHAFLSTVHRVLGLQNFCALSQRLEEHLEEASFEPYNVAVSRATFPVAVWLEKANSLVSATGIIIAMEGQVAQDLPEHAMRHSYTLGGKGTRTRALIIMSKK